MWRTSLLASAVAVLLVLLLNLAHPPAGHADPPDVEALDRELTGLLKGHGFTGRRDAGAPRLRARIALVCNSAL